MWCLLKSKPCKLWQNKLVATLAFFVAFRVKIIDSRQLSLICATHSLTNCMLHLPNLRWIPVTYTGTGLLHSAALAVTANAKLWCISLRDHFVHCMAEWFFFYRTSADETSTQECKVKPNSSHPSHTSRDPPHTHTHDITLVTADFTADWANFPLKYLHMCRKQASADKACSLKTWPPQW